MLSQVGVEAARAGINPVQTTGNENDATKTLRAKLDLAAAGSLAGHGVDERGRIIVPIPEDAVIVLHDTLIIGGNTHLEAHPTAKIRANFPTVPQTYTKDTANAHSASPSYGATFTSVKVAPQVAHATMVINHVPSASTGRYTAPGKIKISGGIWEPIFQPIQGSGTDDRAKATAAPPLNVITMQHTSDVELDNLTIVDVKWWHAIELNAVHTATVSRCRLTGWVEDPTVGLWHGEAVQLDLAGSTVWKGAADNTACQNIRLVDNVCTASADKPAWGRFAGTHSSAVGAVHTDVTIEFNRITGTKFDAIGPQDTSRLSVRSNTVTNCRGGIYLKGADNSLSRVDIVDNVVSTTDAARPALAVSTAVPTLTITDVAVQGNTVSGPGAYWYSRATARPDHSLQGQ